ncbi:(5-formylfuran-3-yl)methyl phosphate synthase [Xanthobacter sediminis]
MSAPGFLASVANLDEMDTALAFGVDILDLKNPAEGALGAWATGLLEAAVARWRHLGGAANLSATVGDHPLYAATLAAAAARTAATGVPLVKIGFALPSRGAEAALAPCLAALAPIARDTRLIAVLFADQEPDTDLVPAFAAAGFAGVMLDTADKSAGGLRQHLDGMALARFVDLARRHGLMTGLAGSLKLADIAPLAALRPDYLGFRGALCAAGRTGALDGERLAAVANALRKTCEIAA